MVLLVCITFIRTLISKHILNATIDYWWNLYNLALYLNNLAVNYCCEPHAGLSCPANESFRLTRDPLAPAARMQFKKRCSVKWIGCGHVGIMISVGVTGFAVFYQLLFSIKTDAGRIESLRAFLRSGIRLRGLSLDRTPHPAPQIHPLLIPPTYEGNDHGLLTPVIFNSLFPQDAFQYLWTRSSGGFHFQSWFLFRCAPALPLPTIFYLSIPTHPCIILQPYLDGQTQPPRIKLGGNSGVSA